MMIEKRIVASCRKSMCWYHLLLRAAGRQRHKGTFVSMRLCRAHLGVERAERHDTAWRSIMETASLDATHVDIAHIHELFEREVGRDGFVALFRVFEQCEGVAQRRPFSNGEEQVLRYTRLLL